MQGWAIEIKASTNNEKNEIAARSRKFTKLTSLVEAQFDEYGCH